MDVRAEFSQRSEIYTSDSEEELYLNAKTLPDIVLFKIFEYLRFWEICKCGEVCRRWYQLSRVVLHNLRIVDLSHKRLSYHQLDKLVPQLPVTTRYLHLTALCSFGKTLFITPYLLQLIGLKCPNLKTLILDGAFIAKDSSMTDINLEDIPDSVTTLSFRRGFFHADQFLYYSPSNSTSNVRKFSNISRLDLGACWCIDDNDIPFLSRLPYLNELHLNNCEYVSNRGIFALSSCVLGSTLKVLNLENNHLLTDVCCVLSLNCPNLEKLYLANTGTKESDLLCLKNRPFAALHELCLQRINFTDDAVPSLVINQKKLLWLNLTGTKVSQTGIKKVHDFLPNCSVVFHSDRTIRCEHFLSNKFSS